MKKIVSLFLVVALLFLLTGCSSNSNNEASSKEILIAAAASLKNCMDFDLIPMFNEINPNIKVNATYDSSGKLQTQIEEGAEVDVFISAAMKQMKALDEQKLIKDNSIIELLENKIVLIVPKETDKLSILSFEEILKADKIAIGDPESVPAGQYAKEALENLKLWDDVKKKVSIGTNVTEVLNWVAEGSADAGIVYSTDAASNDKVKVLAIAPEGSVSKVIYPAGIIKNSKNANEAKLFMEFLQSEEAINVFEKYGFVFK